MTLTHDYLADMLGSNRSTVSVAAEHLLHEGLIRYSRGKLAILDRPGVEQRSCECYRLLQDHLENYMEVEQS
jgi:Mn-dependent DtxR family transcriptional regulator